jgi:DNA mismatch repair protein MutS2
MRIAVDLSELVPAGATAATAPEVAASAASASGVALARARTISDTLDVRGARVDEALEALDRYVDDAIVAGLAAVTVVHGVGTGALRDAVRRHAAAHADVRSARPGGRGEGGDGATILEL